MNNMPLMFFDLDGTLVDSRQDLAESINAVRASYRLPPLPQEVIVGYIGDGIQILLGRAIPEIPRDRLDEAVERMADIYGRHALDNTRLYPEVKETLQELASRHTLILASNKATEPSCQILRGLGICDLFTEICGSCRKPNPDVLLDTMKRHGCPPADAWMVGDNHTDLAAAENAGMRSCFCAFGFGRRKEGQRADALIQSFSQLALFF